MKHWIAVVSLVTAFASGAAAQNLDIKRKNCYDRGAAQRGKKFVDWECGKIAGVIDCNEKLEFDEGSNTLFSKSSGSPYSGTCETCHSNGILEHRITFVNGKENGMDTTYYESGCMMVVRNHISGKENGLWTFYYDSTQRIAWEMNYLNGQKHGKQVFMNAKGDTTLLENYSNGVLNGIKKTYYPKSKPEKVVNYANGVFNGLFITYNKEGKMLQSVNYKQGKKDGACTYYYDDGVLMRTENWSMDAKNGEFKTLYYDQSLQTLESYKKNKGKKFEILEGEVYECMNQQTSLEVRKMLEQDNMTAKQVEMTINNKTNLAISAGKFDVASTPPLYGRKLKTGLNEPYEFNQKYYVVKVKGVTTIVPAEIREGWFEERYPNKKMKRHAYYKNNVLMEEHIFNEQGKEIKTYGGTSSKGAEDDKAPVDNSKKKKEKKKKEKAPETK